MDPAPNARPPVNWRLREATAADQPGILALREQVFQVEDPEKRDPEFWQWEFAEAPAGHARLFVAVDGERIVGHYGVIPQRFLLSGQEVRGSIVVDVMTHPDYRFQGMFKKIGRYALAAVADEIAFATGYPIRKEVMPGHLSIGWTAHLKIPVLVRPLHLGALARRFGIPGGALLDACAAQVRRLAQSLRRDHRPGAVIGTLGESDVAAMADVARQAYFDVDNVQVRDAAFLGHRYFQSPVWRYRITGIHLDGRLLAWTAVRDASLLATPSLAIVDLACLPGEDDALDTLLRHELAAGHARGLATAGAMITRGHRHYRALRRAGLLPGPHRFTLILYRTRTDATPNPADHSKRWFLTWGDTDDV